MKKPPVKKIDDLRYTLEFDREGNLVKIGGKNPFAQRPKEWQFGEDMGEDTELGEPEEIDVKDQKIDSHGNWTSRTVGDDSQERTIEYWQ